MNSDIPFFIVILPMEHLLSLLFSSIQCVHESNVYALHNPIPQILPIIPSYLTVVEVPFWLCFLSYLSVKACVTVLIPFSHSLLLFLLLFLRHRFPRFSSSYTLPTRLGNKIKKSKNSIYSKRIRISQGRKNVGFSLPFCAIYLIYLPSCVRVGETS